ncbi:MAG TPA: phospholipase D-like domain-containing protein [Deltaproteobacteria bacterium]|nr:phospholipase D-like domain-containing protein [Deltaproteobacteria bacterium]HQI81098.1 phospholipase D-like domain-containing protein [Deltaproteobacteria bacterium]
MDSHNPLRTFPEVSPAVRLLAEQAFSRAAGAPLIPGNSITLLRDGTENYPAWLDAMRAAERHIHFENYFITDDVVGREFARVMAEKAAQGVKVRLVYDWLGSMGKASRSFWRLLADAGVEVRCFNPPRIDQPLGLLSRDHRKMVAVDGTVGFVTGLCVGSMWAGNPGRSVEPWRDTGVMITGPAVADIEHAFADVWAGLGPALPREETPSRGSIHPTGDVTLQVVASVPYTAGLYRLDQLIAAVARSSLWLTDAYFVGIPTYVQALMAAARDGVDVRLLVPGSTDIPVLAALSRAGYQPLLEAGVRVFEWNGPMLHAKTAVADGRWARIGSTNLNLSSWMGNYELDVAVEDETFAGAMERMYLEDLARSTEIVLSKRKGVCLSQQRPRRKGRLRGRDKGRMSRAGMGVIRFGTAVEAAITAQRTLGPAESRITLVAGAVLLALGVLAVLWPQLLALPFAGLSIWLAGALFLRAYRLSRTRAPSREARYGPPARHAHRDCAPGPEDGP